MKYLSKFKVIISLLAIIFAVVYSAPNFLSKEKKEKLESFSTVNLGLDLKGGAYLLLEVDLDTVISERYEGLKDAIRQQLLYDGKERIGYRNLKIRAQKVFLSIRDEAKLDKAINQIRKIDYKLDVKEDGKHLTVSYSKSALREIKKSALDRSIAIIRKRIDATGTREPSIQIQGDKYIAVQLPGVKDPERIKDLIGKTAKMTFHLVNEKVDYVDIQNGNIPATSKVLSFFTEEKQLITVYERAELGGEHLMDAKPGYDEHGRPAVFLQFNTAGANLFAKITAQNVDKRFAIVLDNKVLTAPVINEKIGGGHARISGSFSVQETQNLSLLLKSGALPAPITIVEERTVGPELGADSIKAGTIASILGLILVVIFMMLTYGLFGFFADVVLAINMLLILALLSTLGATLTLPGIAGIVLTIGMAVDANVLIFERIREENKTGTTPLKAIEGAYDRAFVIILDSNLTTLAASLLLFQFGSGPVRGFAVTLGIGVLTSMFTSVVISRIFLTLWAVGGRNNKAKKLPI